ncbi:Aristolochene synthase [Phyllosticta capitalensis]|uniref:Terpene synthase n=1 Tax=Phyllosticta capitalensis TaxID=121624 RepID=A0ABR1YW57_9PEZI
MTTFDVKPSNYVFVVDSPENNATSPIATAGNGPTGPLRTTRWRAACHLRAREVCERVDRFYYNNWPFKSIDAKKKFLKTGIPRFACLSHPKAADDRIYFACSLYTLLFLIDDLLEDMSLTEGKAFNRNLVPLMRGERQPDRSIPVEWITYDLWKEMRTCDTDLTAEVFESTLDFMDAQTEQVRIDMQDFGQYLKYRDRDVGQGVMAAVGRYTIGIRLTSDEFKRVSRIDTNCARHLGVVNDICSWDKEFNKSQESKEEGAVLCSAVKTLADVSALSPAAAKRLLWTMVGEWEIQHEELHAQLIRSGEGYRGELGRYISALEDLMSGHLHWSITTPRYGFSESRDR